MSAEAAQRHRGTRAVQRLVEYAPATGGLALWVLHRDVVAVPGDAAPVTTDGHTLAYTPAFEQLPLPLQTGWVAHEVLHVALRHPQRQLALQQQLGDVDAKLFNACADAIVNSALSHLGWLQLPPSAVFLDALLAGALGVRDAVEKSLLEWDVERLYRAIDDRRLPGTGSEGQPRRDGPRAAQVRALAAHSATDLRPDAGSATAPEAEAVQAREWRERLLRAHTGDGEFSLLRTLVADLAQPRTPWEQVLRVQLARCLSKRPALSWSRPTRSYIANQGRLGRSGRLPWEPGFGGMKAVPKLALVVDVSGSVDDALLGRFAAEIDAITRRLEAGLLLVIGDDQVRQVLPCQPGHSSLRDIRFHGGGGTDFTPLLEEAARHDPDLIVVLTDLQGPARYRPRRPVLWAVPEAFAAALPPFGRLLALR
jgi:predicted metal-dependent peptidase